MIQAYQGAVNSQTQIPSGWCSGTYTGDGPVTETDTWNSIIYRLYYSLNYNIVEYEPPDSSDCGMNAPLSVPVLQTRQITCEGTGWTLFSGTGGTTAYCACPWGTICAPKPCRAGCVPKSDPIETLSGVKTQVEADYVGAGPFPLRVERTYNSQYAQLHYFGFDNLWQPLGIGWNSRYFQWLSYSSAPGFSGVTVHRADGSTMAFNDSGTALVGVNGESTDRMVRTYSGGSQTGYQYIDGSDTVEQYNLNGQLLSITDRTGIVETLQYDAATGIYLASVTNSFGGALLFNWDSVNQRVSSITDPAGNSISYGYDGSNNLTSVHYQDTTSRTYEYELGDSGYPNLLTGITDESNNRLWTWGYDVSGGTGNVTSSQKGSSSSYVEQYSVTYNPYSYNSVVTDPLGTANTYSYTVVYGEPRYTGASVLCSGCGEYQSLTYDTNGDIVARTDFDGNQTTLAYDTTRTLETSRTEALTSSGGATGRSRTTTTSWNSGFRLPNLVSVYAGTTATGTPLRTTSYTYDGSGNGLTRTITDTTVTPNVTRTWTYTYNSFGQVLTADGPRTDVSDVTTYTYYTCSTGTQCGQVHTVTDAAGHVTTYTTYNAHGQPLTITDPNGVVTTLTYDSRLRLTSRQVNTETTSFAYYPMGLLKKVTLPDSSYLQYTYDNFQRLTEVSDGAGNSVVYTLDAMGNKTAENAYDPSSVLHRTHTRVYNALNQLYQDINAANTSAVTTTYGYDSNGNQNSIAAPLSRNIANAYDELNRLKQITDPASGNTYFTYDSIDNLTSVKDPRSLTTSYTYNGFGDVKTQTSPDTGTTTNTYDSGGNLATSTDARSAISTYTYNALNRPTSVAYKIGSSTDQTIAFTYDAGTYGKGRLTGASDANHSMSWTYDALGRVTGKGQTVGTVTKSVGYAYTNADLVTLTTPSGQTLTYGYNTNHQIISIALNGTTTILNNVTYEPLGPVNGWAWGNAATVTRSYNTDGVISQINATGVKTFTYDNALRITGIADTSTGASSWTYGYDLLDRITSGVGGSTTRGWTYDANSNRKTETGSAASTYTISSTNNRISSITGALPRTYSYDAAGHVLTYSTITVTYYDRGRLKTVKNGSVSETLIYNALGQMVETSGGAAGTVLYMYDESGHLLGEYSSTGALVEETVWLGDTPVATLRPSGSTVALYYLEADHLNTPRQGTRPSDNKQMWTWFSDPFGTSAANSNPAGAGAFIYNLRFPGQIYDSQAGLQQNWNREYDPAVGRYAESDPIGLRGGINTYVYVKGRPTGSIDPSGLVQWTGTGVTFGAVPGGGGVFGIYDLVSACVNKMKVHARVHVAGFAVGFGSIVSASGGAITLKDDLSTPDYSALEGSYKAVWLAAALGGGYSLGAVQLGEARALPANGAIGGLDASIGGAAGTAWVVQHDTRCCTN
jgi:RHS repeat-associated protein